MGLRDAELGLSLQQCACVSGSFGLAVVGRGGRTDGRHGLRGGGGLRTIGARALYRATLRDDLPEYVLLVSIPFYLDLRGKAEMMNKVGMDPCVPELTE